MNYVEDYNQILCQKIAMDIDTAIYKFLNNMGYTIESRWDFNRLDEIKKELEEKGLVIDYVCFTPPYTQSDLSTLKVTSYIYPFFNYIYNPINKDELIKTLQEKYDRGEL